MNIPALIRLQQDHRNIETLLRLLDRQRKRLGDGFTPDFALMEDILHYLTRYQDRFHHPFEELLTGGETRLAPGSPEMIRPCPICTEA